MRVRQLWTDDDGRYLSVLLLAVVVARAVEFGWPPARVFDVSAATACAVVGVVLAAVSWLGYRARSRWDLLAVAFLVAWLCAWGLAVWGAERHDDAVDLGLVVPPLAALLLLLKRPTGPAVTRALDILAWATAVLFLGVLLAQIVGLLDNAVESRMSEYEQEKYWLPLSGLVGFDGRWIGPFRSANVTASGAVFLVVYGASRGWLSRVVLVCAGALALLLTGTRSSAFATLGGLIALLVLQPTSRRVLRRLRWAFVAAAGAAFVLVVGYWVTRNPSLSGRLEIWPVFVDLWQTDPWGGVGDAGVGLAVEAGTLPPWATHAHSVFIDPLARSGIAAAAALVLVLVLAAVLSVRATRHGRPIGLALLVSLLIGGLTETLFDWRYLGFQLVVLVGAVLLSAAYERPRVLLPHPSMSDGETAVGAARAGAKVVRACYRTPVAIHEKPGEDFATDADLAAERASRRVLAKARATDAVVGEELGASGADADRTWLVDPLCGTVNFAAGLPLFGTNVALREGDELTIGATADPLADEVLWGDATGAYRRRRGTDTPLTPDATTGMVTLDGDPAGVGPVGRLVRDGAFSSDFRPRAVASTIALAWVASGRMAAYVSDDATRDSVHYAAGIAVCVAAGCVVTDAEGAPVTSDSVGLLVAADAATHAALLAMIRA